MTDPSNSAPSHGHTSGPHKPKHFSGGTKSPQAQSCAWLQFQIRSLTHELRDAVQQKASLLLPSDTVPNLQQPSTLTALKAQFPLHHHGVQARHRWAPCPGCQGPGHRQPRSGTPFPRLPVGQRAPLPLTSMAGRPSFPLRLVPGPVLLLRANKGLFSGCPVLAKPTVKISDENH